MALLLAILAMLISTSSGHLKWEFSDLTNSHVSPPPRWTRPPAQHESSHWLQPDSTLTSTGPSPADWMKSPPWPTWRPSSRTAARPTAKEGSRPSSSERWRTSRSKQDWASWTAASPPTSPNQRPRTDNVYKDLQYITTSPQLVFANLFFQGKWVVSLGPVLQYMPYLMLPYEKVYFLIFLSFISMLIFVTSVLYVCYLFFFFLSICCVSANHPCLYLHLNDNTML